MAIAGIKTTSSFANNQLPGNFREALLRLYPNGMAPLTALTSQMKSKETDNPEFHWWEKEMQTRELVLHATSGDLSAVAGETEITLASDSPTALSLILGDIIRVNHTGELLRVVQTPTEATKVRVSRGFAGTTVTAVDANGTGVSPRLTILGSAFEQGSAAPTSVSYNPVQRTGRCQIFRRTISITNTAKATETRTGDEYAEMKREALELMGADMERYFFFGKSSVGTLNSKPFYTTDGIDSLILTENKLTATAGILDMDTLEDWCTKIFRFTNKNSEKVLFCGDLLALYISRAVRKNTTFNFEPTTKEYGMDIRKLHSPNGTLVIKTHPLFSQLEDYRNMGFVLDLTNIHYRYMRGRDLSFKDELQIPGTDGKLAGYLAEAGLEVDLLKTHFKISGITGAAADAVAE